MHLHRRPCALCGGLCSDVSWEGAVLDLKGALLPRGPGWGCGSQRWRGTSAQELQPQLGFGSAVHPGWWHGVSQRSQLSPASAGSRIVVLSPPLPTRLSPQPRPPRPWPHSLPGSEDAQSQARLRLQTPRNSRLLQSPHGPPRTSRPPQNPREPRRTSSAQGYAGAQAQRPRLSGGALARLAAASILCSDRAFRAQRLLPGGVGRARAASAEVGRSELAGRGGCRWAGISALPGSSAPRKVQEWGAGQARQGVPGSGSPAEPRSPRSPPSLPGGRGPSTLPGAGAPPCPGYPTKRSLRS